MMKYGEANTQYLEWMRKVYISQNEIRWVADTEANMINVKKIVTKVSWEGWGGGGGGHCGQID